MFPSAKHIPPPTIKMYRGNTHTVTFDNLMFNGEDKTAIEAGESILFIVKSLMGTTVLSKTLVATDTETPIQFDLIPDDTIDLCSPFKYQYSVDLYTNNGETFFTLQKGNFVLMDPIGTIADIND